MPMERVSIVMPAFNVERYIVEAVRSALEQTHAAFEILVVDDGSSDGTLTRLKELHSFPTLQILQQPNRGASAARNAGIAAAQGDIVTFLDADDRLHPQLLEKSVEMLSRNPGLDLVFPLCRHVDADGQPTGVRSKVSAPRFDFRSILVKNPIHSASGVSVRRSALMKVEGFDESLSSNVDFDLWLRVAAIRPNNVAVIAQWLLDYRQRPGQLTGDWRRMAENWERVLARSRSVDPATVARLEGEARAHSLLYWSTIARRQGDFNQARAMVGRAWRIAPVAMLCTRHAWTMAWLTLLR